VREGVDVKLLAQEQELYVLAQSHARINKERAMRRRKLKWLWARLKQIAAMDLDREELLMKLGAARAKARAAWRLVDVAVAPKDPRSASRSTATSCAGYVYLLRTNLCDKDPAELWRFYIQLVEIEAMQQRDQSRTALAHSTANVFFAAVTQVKMQCATVFLYDRSQIA
jgi:hypothetical protein